MNEHVPRYCFRECGRCRRQWQWENYLLDTDPEPPEIKSPSNDFNQNEPFPFSGRSSIVAQLSHAGAGWLLTSGVIASKEATLNSTTNQPGLSRHYILKDHLGRSCCSNGTSPFANKIYPPRPKDLLCTIYTGPEGVTSCARDLPTLVKCSD